MSDPTERTIWVKADLHDVLIARERRVERRRAMLNQNGVAAVMTLTLVWPGSRKRTPATRLFFCLCRDEIRLRLRAHGLMPLSERGDTSPAGDDVMWSFADDSAVEPHGLKRLAIEMETFEPGGRLLDLDVHTNEGPVGREALGLEPRHCFICDRPAHQCTRSGAHAPESVVRAAETELIRGLSHHLQSRVTRAALEATVNELLVLPKPGLVTGAGNGSHDDMTRFSYAASTASLVRYFNLCSDLAVRASLAGWPKESIARWRAGGLEAERRMLDATGERNTHKGLIYHLGLAIASFVDALVRTVTERGPARLSSSGFFAETAAGDRFAEAIRASVRDLSRRLAELPRVQRAETVGEHCRRRYGAISAKEVALAGMPQVFRVACPLLSALRSAGFSQNECGVAVLLVLLALTDDTTLIKRAGHDGFLRVRRELTRFFDLEPAVDAPSVDPALLISRVSAMKPSDILSFAFRLDRQFTARKWSAGGAADLLAVTFFLDRMIREAEGGPGGTVWS